MSGLHRVRCSAACHRVVHFLQLNFCHVPRQQLLKSAVLLVPHSRLAPFPFAFQLSDELLIADLRGMACFWVSQVAASAGSRLRGICRCRPYGARSSPCVTADYRLGTWIVPKASSYLVFLQLHQLEGNTEQEPQLAITLGKESLWEVRGQ